MEKIVRNLDSRKVETYNNLRTKKQRNQENV